jgi:ribosome-associated translation inhibitor RaiA
MGKRCTSVVSDAHCMSSDDVRRDRLDERSFRLGAGFREPERERILEALATLGPHLARWDPNEVEVDVSVRGRGSREQRVTLRALLPGHPPLVAVGRHADLERALAQAKRELIIQIDRHRTEQVPKRNRLLRRTTIRRPEASAGAGS